MIPIVLTIAGSDSSAGAGIQADLKAISANGGYGASVITAITAQNTRGVTAAAEVDLDLIRAQVDAVFDDLQVAAVKTGHAGLRRGDPRRSPRRCGTIGRRTTSSTP